jgi:hypothetical protein
MFLTRSFCSLSSLCYAFPLMPTNLAAPSFHESTVPSPHLYDACVENKGFFTLLKALQAFHVLQGFR